MQSPVDINFMQTSFMSFEDLYFLGYGVDYPFVVENGGHAGEHEPASHIVAFERAPVSCVLL